MSANAWELHLNTRGDPAIQGTWRDDTPWDFYTYDHLVAPELPVHTGMCVPVCSLNPSNPQVMLTLNIERGGFEIPGGHLDALEAGGVEDAPIAAARETEEETGLSVAPSRLLPYGYVEARNPPGSAYPPRTYMQFFGVWAPDHPGLITDFEVDGAGIFTWNALRRMAERGAMKTTELQLVGLGIRRVFRDRRIPDEHITLP